MGHGNQLLNFGRLEGGRWAHRIMASFSLKNLRPYRLVLKDAGPHRFGGEPIHAGSLPCNSDTPLQLFLMLDLTDPNCPVKLPNVSRIR